MREPAFWWRKRSLSAALLAPVAACYGAVAARRMARDGARAGVPVICVGNYTLGGAGKTPTAILLAKLLVQGGETPFILSRGYGGSVSAAKRVDVQADRAAEVGDEALLLARAAPTIVSPDRVAGAALAQQQGASVIVMDDGLQNASLKKDFTIAVVDARRGLGNERVFPAGPLRAPLAPQLAATDALLVVGDGDGAAEVVQAARRRGLPVWHGKLVPEASSLADLRRSTVLAFAGIGDPDKFFASAEEVGLVVAERAGFPDHHRFTAQEAAELIARAERAGLALVTTEKDRARMMGDPALDALAARVRVLPVTIAVSEVDELRILLRQRIGR